ncbi:hypothetical protein NS228_02320 [Methylobacterium indicum]|uniref:Large exoprotein involved in heme utilization or adhesion n=1 Tax=Methylobacterium indicum TaxID=1775910 RepID=A0A8H8WWI3_9HYPH|nr:hypothetical protein [Methylobacterium indicum]KTS25541.1 hypothetical protein NS229_19380 [Methylobacterium indicum]KTS42440.1 hypothetical protein NS228_02320 [Methylobacterium indicum]KTS47299.1 hypothetical protein NS230_21135 [Methylobacterium indicum]BCM85528.1 hypothetical protein mvi_39890 [Methylobacterium indicum]
MTSSRFPILLPAVCLVLAGPASAAPSANRFDGAWSVVATAETGTCTGPYRYPIVIRDGVVDDAGGNGVDASGRAGADGRITGTIRSGLASVSVTGRLRGAAGQGRWSLAGISPCAGRWTARRTG